MTLNIVKMSTLDRLVYWICERESIRLQKKVGNPKPWTDDKILQSYRFCNIRRMDDRVSMWLFDKWYRPNHNHPNMVLACVAARHFNRETTLGVMRFPKMWSPNKIKERLRRHRTSGFKLFNGAYMIRASGEYPDKLDMVIDETIQQFYNKRPNLDNVTTMEEAVSIFREYRGFGSFMAGQVVADLRWAIKHRWTDCETWAPPGPGSKRGLNRLNGRGCNESMSDVKFASEFGVLLKILRNRLPRPIVRKMEAIDWQNCLCEFDKYERCLWQEGRPKQLYGGV